MNSLGINLSEAIDRIMKTPECMEALEKFRLSVIENMKKPKTILLLLLLIPGCTVVSANRTFPKLDWYWSADAKEQRKESKP